MPENESAVPGTVPRAAWVCRRTAPSAPSPAAADLLPLGPGERATGASTPYAARNGCDNPPTLLLDPRRRSTIDRGGFTSKEKLIDWLYDNARLPASEYWDYQLIQNYIYPRATFGEEPWASQLKALPEELIPMFRREDIHVVVVGGETNGYWRIMGCNYQKTVSIDEWR